MDKNEVCVVINVQQVKLFNVMFSLLKKPYFDRDLSGIWN